MLTLSDINADGSSVIQNRCVDCCLDGVRPVCLPRLSESFPPDSPCWVTGWGYTHEGGEIMFLKRLQASRTLVKVSFTLSYRVGVLTLETGFSSGYRSVRMLTVQRVRLPTHSQNALCWRYGGRSGLLSGIHIH